MQAATTNITSHSTPPFHSHPIPSHCPHDNYAAAPRSSVRPLVQANSSGQERAGPPPNSTKTLPILAGRRDTPRPWVTPPVSPRSSSSSSSRSHVLSRCLLLTTTHVSLPKCICHPSSSLGTTRSDTCNSLSAGHRHTRRLQRVDNQQEHRLTTHVAFTKQTGTATATARIINANCFGTEQDFDINSGVYSNDGTSPTYRSNTR